MSKHPLIFFFFVGSRHFEEPQTLITVKVKLWPLTSAKVPVSGKEDMFSLMDARLSTFEMCVGWEGFSGCMDTASAPHTTFVNARLPFSHGRLLAFFHTTTLAWPDLEDIGLSGKMRGGFHFTLDHFVMSVAKANLFYQHPFHASTGLIRFLYIVCQLKVKQVMMFDLILLCEVHHGSCVGQWMDR